VRYRPLSVPSEGEAVLAFNADVYNGLKFIHVLAAISWVGSGLFVQYRGSRLRRTGTPEQTANLAREVADSTPWFMGTSLLVLIAGVTLVLYAPGLDFTDTWILLGLAGFAATFVTGFFFIRPTAEKLAAAAASEGPTSPTAQALIARIFAISRVDQVVLVLVILDMVFKPGA
jgi:uncharacterized membrane protein